MPIKMFVLKRVVLEDFIKLLDEVDGFMGETFS